MLMLACSAFCPAAFPALRGGLVLPFVPDADAAVTCRCWPGEPAVKLLSLLFGTALFCLLWLQLQRRC